MYQRVIEQMNAALGAVHLSADPAGKDKPAEFWQERAIKQLRRAISLYNAWNNLIRYKSGLVQIPKTMRQFRGSEMLEWLASELSTRHTLEPEHERLLAGNRETLQEALLLLHSCAHTLGPGVRLVTQNDHDGMWFRVRYNIYKTPPQTLEALLDQLPENWRAEHTVFELQRAQDFLAMNQCTLEYRVEDTYCELGFFVKSARAAKTPASVYPTTTQSRRVPLRASLTAQDGKETALPPSLDDLMLTPLDSDRDVAAKPARGDSEGKDNTDTNPTAGRR